MTKKYSLFLILVTLIFIKSCCYKTQCAPCIGEPNLWNLGSPILKFDTSNLSYKITDLDTLYLYKNILELPSDTIINYENKTEINGYNLRLYNYISDKFKSRIIKIDSLNYIVTKKGEGCCGCYKYEVKSIEINDSVFAINKLPLIITK